MATNQWSTLATYNRTHVNYTPSGSYSGYSFRIRALLSDGKYWYSNTVTWYYYVPDQSFDISGALNPPKPEISGPDYTITVWPDITYSEPQYNKALQVLGSGIYNSKLGPYVMIAFGLLGSFAIVGYLAFRMH